MNNYLPKFAVGLAIMVVVYLLARKIGWKIEEKGSDQDEDQGENGWEKIGEIK